VSGLEYFLIGCAGLGAGAINTLVGSGTLITFPTLLAFGVPPVTANASNSIGLVPGALSGAYGYRTRLRGQGWLVRRLLPASFAGALVGALLLLALPASAFDAIVPALIALGVVLVAVQPWLVRRTHGTVTPAVAGRVPVWLLPAVAIAGVYGGYFGAAQGVILLALLGLRGSTDVQADNAVKNVLAAAANGASAIVFSVSGVVDWRIVVTIAASSAVGGQVGAVVGQRIPRWGLRLLIVTIGSVAFAALVWR
jgi:uncharacterized membrane protein YfcA